eukprot:CAMPEP_0115726982 /NCGR_PEP_ID=MMETSP0272-20121206/82182_1 /TAXON_ID=71861 /ORGANISM="Scrippsiella trochoidea, Strain CCMP3099" /LENGTH=122 /DNA_ID=CAMNT_0003170469 /DNA_START=473 /DNA_END=838 /DNA_ORIENTATION=-
MARHRLQPRGGHLTDFVVAAVLVPNPTGTRNALMRAETEPMGVDDDAWVASFDGVRGRDHVNAKAQLSLRAEMFWETVSWCTQGAQRLQSSALYTLGLVTRAHRGTKSREATRLLFKEERQS